ncbi:MAG: DnaJ domain-containing protein [Nanoarchaeota archaeon]
MLKFNDYYEVLGLPRTATPAEIKKTYRRLARRVHPDVNHGSKDAEEVFKFLGEAYSVLFDPERRRQYDISLQTATLEPINKVDPKIRKDLETIVETIARVAATPISYLDFFIGYELWGRLSYAQNRFEAYRDKTSHTVAEIEEKQRLEKRTLRDLERLLNLSKKYKIPLPELNGLFEDFRETEILSIKYQINIKGNIKKYRN